MHRRLFVTSDGSEAGAAAVPAAREPIAATLLTEAAKWPADLTTR
ncbi:MAG: hypothetical protein ABL900_11080 [Burkholderiaceae bacterium]